MTNPALTIGIVVASFMVVAVFAFVLNCMVRAKQRERFIQCTAFAFLIEEETRFSGKVKRVKVTPKRPSPEELVALQEYYDTSEPTGWEREIIEYTFKIMQMLGFEVKLFRSKGRGKNRKREEVDLSKRFVKPSREVRAEIKRAQKGRIVGSSEGDEEELNDEESGGTASGSLNGPREELHPPEEAKGNQLKRGGSQDFAAIGGQGIGAKLKVGLSLQSKKTKPKLNHSSDDSSSDDVKKPPTVVSKTQAKRKGRSKAKGKNSSSDDDDDEDEDSLSSSSSDDDDTSPYNNKPRGFGKAKKTPKQVSTPKRQTKQALAQYYEEYERQQQKHYEHTLE